MEKEKDPALSVTKRLLSDPEFFKKSQEEQWKEAEKMFAQEKKKANK